MDPSSIIIIVGVFTLVIEKIATWANHIRKSSCCGFNLEMEEERNRLID